MSSAAGVLISNGRFSFVPKSAFILKAVTLMPDIS